MNKKYSFYPAFKSRKDLKQFGSNALTLFALQLFFGIEDITLIATNDIIVDGPDDSGLDLVYIDKQQKFVVIAQEYKAKSKKKIVAPTKKVRYLSNGLTQLLKMPIDKVPKGLRSSAEELREALKKGEIEVVYIWYVHNLPGSKNIEKELRIIEENAKALLNNFDVNIKSLEVCAEKIEERYISISTPILVKEKFKISISGGILVKGNNWKAFVTSVPLRWFYEQFKKHGTNLFSANVRDYLGITKKSDKNINKGIKETAQNDPSHFWVFNNGIAALVHDFKLDNKNKDIFYFSGLSILNGAQTTGAIGNLTKIPDKKALVQVRFVQCTDGQTVVNIKKYNNSQNKIEAPDFRSKDPIQERLLKEFKSTDVWYSPRRGSIEDIIKRRPNTLLSILAGQVLSAFHGRPDIAYHQKTEIWEDNVLYSRYFNEHLKAKHIIFVYSLFEVIKIKNFCLVKKVKITV